MSDEAEVAPVADGFVRCVNPDLGGSVADLPESALGIHRGRGWIPADELAQAPEADIVPAEADEADADPKES